MTGNKPGSHKARKKSRSSVTKASILSKSKLIITTPENTITPVTQSQDDDGAIPPVTATPRPLNPLAALLSVSSRLLSFLHSPTTNFHAISDIVSGLPLRQLDYNDTDAAIDGVPYAPITQDYPDKGNSPITISDDSHELSSSLSTSGDSPTPDVSVTVPTAFSKRNKKTVRSTFKLTS
jgi:hypothetical protein